MEEYRYDGTDFTKKEKNFSYLEHYKKILMENIDTMEQILQKNKKNLSYL